MDKIKNFKAIYRYDSYYDMLGIKITADYIYNKSVEMKDGVILDFDTNNNPIALQLIGASQIFEISKKSLECIPFIDMKVKIDELTICLDLTLGIETQKQIFNTLIANNTGFPSMEADLATE
jgi:hypothetical protein